MYHFRHLTILIVLVIVNLISANSPQKNQITVKYVNTPNENGYDIYGSDPKFFRDEKWRFHPNGGLFLNRKLGYLQPNLKEFLVTETQIDSFGQHAVSYMMDKNGNVLQNRIDQTEGNDQPKAQNQGLFPGITFLLALYRRPFTTAVGAYLNRPGSGLNWVPIIKDAPTIPPWPFKYPWQRIPKIPFVPYIG